MRNWGGSGAGAICGIAGDSNGGIPIRTTAEFKIEGMDCAQEVSLLKKQLSGRPGICGLSFHILEARMTVKFEPARITVQQITEAVASAGMRAQPWTAPTEAQRRDWRLAATAVSGVLFLAGMLLPDGHPAAILSYMAAVAVGFGPALRKAAAAARALRPDLHVLMTISITGAMVLGDWSEAGALAFLFSLAGLLESWSIGRARSAIASLMELSPASASVLDGQGERRIPAEQLKVGDMVRVRPGERIACDGVVAAGGSTVDQAIITGESMPAEKREGTMVYAGTMNGEGVLEVRVTRPPYDTTLARIIRMVRESESRRAPSERLVERFARYYTPAMLMVAVLVGTVPPLFFAQSWSYWFYQGMVVLLISCPCALVISTPVTIAAALASAARHGVLIKGGVFLEAAARLKAVAFDKTGVLTRGRPVVQSFAPMDGRTEEECLRRLAALENTSEHPLGRAIVEYAGANGGAPPAVAAFQSLPGRGAQAEIAGETFWVGSHRLLREKGLASGEVSRTMANLEDSEHTAVACGTESGVWAVVGLRDPVRPEASSALDALRRAGIHSLVMLTGDNQATARAVSQELGLTAYYPDLLPDDKEKAIEKMRRTAGPVAMVGDGVNDAQAMSAASVGIALGRRSTDVALETADIVLLSGDLMRLPFLVLHARRAARVIRENVVVALGLKAAFLALAAFGLATLWMAVVADMGASLLVTFNGLRLLRASAPARAFSPVAASANSKPA